MKNKGAILLIIYSFKGLAVFSQSPQRMQEKISSNIKEPSETAVVLYNKAHDHFEKKEYTQAIHYYEMAITVDSNYIDAYNNLGLTFYETGSVDSAAYYLQKSLKILPAGTTALQNLALVEEKRSDLPKALAYYKQIVTIEPENPEGYYNVGRVLTTMAKLDEALVQTQKAENLYAKSNSPYLSDCHYLLLVIYFNMNNKAMAKKYLALCKKENFQVPAEIETVLQ